MSGSTSMDATQTDPSLDVLAKARSLLLDNSTDPSKLLMEALETVKMNRAARKKRNATARSTNPTTSTTTPSSFNQLSSANTPAIVGHSLSTFVEEPEREVGTTSVTSLTLPAPITQNEDNPRSRIITSPTTQASNDIASSDQGFSALAVDSTATAKVPAEVLPASPSPPTMVASSETPTLKSVSGPVSRQAERIVQVEGSEVYVQGASADDDVVDDLGDGSRLSSQVGTQESKSSAARGKPGKAHFPPVMHQGGAGLLLGMDEHRPNFYHGSDTAPLGPKYAIPGSSASIPPTSISTSLFPSQSSSTHVYAPPPMVPDPLPFPSPPRPTDPFFMASVLSSSFALATEVIVDQALLVVTLLKWMWPPVHLLCKGAATLKRKELARYSEKHVQAAALSSSSSSSSDQQQLASQSASRRGHLPSSQHNQSRPTLQQHLLDSAASKAAAAATSALSHLPPLPIERPFRLGLVGCGRVGSLLLKTLIERGAVSSSHVSVATRRPEKLDHFKVLNVTCTKDFVAVTQSCSLVIIAVGPHQVVPVATRVVQDATSFNTALSRLLTSPAPSSSEQAGMASVVGLAGSEQGNRRTSQVADASTNEEKTTGQSHPEQETAQHQQQPFSLPSAITSTSSSTSTSSFQLFSPHSSSGAPSSKPDADVSAAVSASAAASSNTPPLKLPPPNIVGLPAPVVASSSMPLTPSNHAFPPPPATPGAGGKESEGTGGKRHHRKPSSLTAGFIPSIDSHAKDSAMTSQHHVLLPQSPPNLTLPSAAHSTKAATTSSTTTTPSEPDAAVASQSSSSSTKGPTSPASASASASALAPGSAAGPGGNGKSERVLATEESAQPDWDVIDFSEFVEHTETIPFFFSLCSGVTAQKLRSVFHTPLVARTRVPLAHAHIGAHHLLESSEAAMRMLLHDILPQVRRLLLLEILRYLERVTLPASSSIPTPPSSSFPDPTFGATAKLDSLLQQALAHAHRELIPATLTHLRSTVEEPAATPSPFRLDPQPPSFSSCGIVPRSFGVAGLPFT